MNDAIEKAEAVSSLLSFAQYCFKKQGKTFLIGQHHSKVCEALERVFVGKCKRLIINIPPRFSKTELLQFFVAYSIGLNPQSNFIWASYGKQLSQQSSVEIRDLIDSQFYKELFTSRLKRGQMEKGKWATSENGKFYSASTTSAITGFGAGSMEEEFSGCIVIDDPVNAVDASRKTILANAIQWYQSSIETRSNSSETPIILIMQRLDEDDLAGYLLDSEEEWEHLCLPAITESGEALWEKRRSLEWLKAKKRSDPVGFASQFMQQPSPEDGSEFERKDIKMFKAEELDDIKLRCTSFYISTDFAVTAPKHGSDPDYTVFTVIGVDGKNNLYILDVWRKQTTSDKWTEELLSLVNIWRPRRILVEKGVIWNSQKPFIEQRQKETMIYCDFLEIARTSDKVASSKSIQGLIRSGRFFMNQDAGYYDNCVSEMIAFPKGKHDDFVDTLSLFGMQMHELIGSRVDSTLDYSRDLGIFY